MAEYFAQVAKSRVETLNQLFNFQKEVVNCSSCSLHIGVKSPVPGQLVPNSDFLFVGLAPGRNGAEKTGIPFTKDKSGRLFRKMVSLIESEGYTVSVTNIVKCNPLNELGNNRNPTSFEVNKCSIHLEGEIRIVKPRMIIILGKITEKFLNISRTQLSNDSGIKSAIASNIPTLTIFHPSAIANYHKKSESEYHALFLEIINIYRAIYNEERDQRKLPIFSDVDYTKSNHETEYLEALKKLNEWR